MIQPTINQAVIFNAGNLDTAAIYSEPIHSELIHSEPINSNTLNTQRMFLSIICRSEQEVIELKKRNEILFIKLN